jgi:NADPH:quinone reductase-like Zn-dependent oxidoreductase
MKTIVWTKYGPPDALQLKEVEKPAPKEDEVLIKVHATSVNYGDSALVSGILKKDTPKGKLSSLCEESCQPALPRWVSTN